MRPTLDTGLVVKEDACELAATWSEAAADDRIRKVSRNPNALLPVPVRDNDLRHAQGWSLAIFGFIDTA